MTAALHLREMVLAIIKLYYILLRNVKIRDTCVELLNDLVLYLYTAEGLDYM